LPAFPGLWLLGRGSRSAQPNLDVAGSFGELIRRTRVHSGERVVVLVDEYDKPILDNLAAPEVARAMHDGLHNLYSVIMGDDAHLRFAFLTGVSQRVRWASRVADLDCAGRIVET
jgi:hypothetical protein